jgi:hypothetical protein
MDIDRILEQLARWLTNPKGREIAKTILYLVVPLIVLFGLRNAARRRPSEKISSSALDPKMRSYSTEKLLTTESVKETMAREQQKIERELQEVFGREKKVLKRTGKNLARADSPRQSPPTQTSQSGEENILQDQLLKIFSRRQK